MLSKELNELGAVLLGKSIKDLYPHASLATFRINENGFVYSFSSQNLISLNDLPKITKQMQKNIDRNFAITYQTLPKNEAKQIFKNDKYKQELINESQHDVDLIKLSDGYHDICSKLNFEKFTGIKAISLSNVSGEY
jgi:threonyl-tRNA synthetase